MVENDIEMSKKGQMGDQGNEENHGDTVLEAVMKGIVCGLNVNQRITLQ